MASNNSSFDELCINTIRFLAVDAVQKANSGHPGMPMGCAPIAYTLFTKFMKYNPANPRWFNRDRFVLSAGHGSMLLYSMLYLTGYDIPMEQLKQFRQWGSITPGHPEAILTPGVETTTGPLGQGLANAVGMAIAEDYIAATYNKEDTALLDHYIYVIASDGDLMEGISHEVSSLAGHLKLGRLIVFYDDNNISIDGPTSLAYSDLNRKRFEGYNWQVLEVLDVNDLQALEAAVRNAQAEKTKPTIIITHTHIGYGSPNKQDTSSAHGTALGPEEVKLTKKNLGWPEDKEFYVPDEAGKFFRSFLEKGQKEEEAWKETWNSYKKKYPEEAASFNALMEDEYGDEWLKHLPQFEPGDKKVATRTASGKVLNAIAAYLPGLIGGSADLAPSTDTMLNDYPAFNAEKRGGRNFHFGVREHGMAGILNGMAIYGGVIPYGSTFLIFSDYLRPAIRLGALSGLRPIYIFTHDSIGLGEDGPTHQPIEHLAALRAIPHILVIRPADANETSYAWRTAIQHKGSPVLIVLSRQGLQVTDQKKFSSAENLAKGAYVLKDYNGGPEPDIILMASGSEVELIIKAAEKLAEEGKKVRAVSFPCWELFEMQSGEYKESVLPAAVKKRISVEAGVTMGWEKYTGTEGIRIGIDRYGASAPGGVVMEKFGFTAENIISKARELLK